MRELGIEESKKIELQILLEFDKFCKENNLTYFLAYGTLIGAVRHKGFIPWDDDIDINMPRKDYCWLIENYNKMNPNGRYKVIAPEMDFAQHTFVKFIDTTTIKLEPNIVYSVCLGIDIDVFPLDGQPENENTYNKWYDKLNRVYRLYNICKMDESADIKRRIVVPIIRLLTGGKQKLLAKAAALHQKYPYEESNFVGSIESVFDEKNVRFPKKWFEKSVVIEFEGYKISAPQEYDKILKQIYGNYMELPPENERVTHHTNKIFLLEQNEKIDNIKMKLNKKGEVLNK